MDKAEEIDNSNEKEELYSKVIRAGKRTYFFDVRATRKDDYYLTITESKKRFDKDGKPFYEKHKIFIYNEDFEKFMTGLTDAISFIGSETVDSVIANQSEIEKDESDFEYTNVEFEDLGEK
jgi:hypothetical protein